MKKNIFLATNIFLSIALTGCSSPTNFIKNNKVSQKDTINVTIANGTIPSPTTNTPQSYQSTVFALKDGNCSKTNIVLANNENVNLKTCFTGNVLFVDAERSKLTSRNQTIRFYLNPLWQQGYTYQNITTNGKAHLTNADIRIKILNNS